MPDITTTTIFSTGETVTAAIMNSIVSNCTIQPSFVTGKTIQTSLANGDLIFGVNAAGSAMQTISYANLLAEILAVPQIASSAQYGTYNGLMNGDFSVMQRNSTFTSIAATSYTFDKWKWEITGTASRATVTQTYPTTIATLPFVSPSLSSPTAMKVAVASATGSVAAGDLQAVTQIIENCYFAPLASTPMSLSFLYKTNFSGNLSVALRDQANGWSLVLPFVTNGDGAWHLAQFANIAMPTTSGAWQLGTYGAASMKLTVTFLAGSTFQTATTGSWINSNAMATNVQGNFMVSGSNTFEWTQAMLNPGTVCLPFITESFTSNLLKCQRYFSKTYNYGTAPGANTGSSAGFIRSVAAANNLQLFMSDYTLPAVMRSTPTVVSYSTDGTVNSVRDATLPGNRVASSSGASDRMWTVVNMGTASTAGNFLEAQATFDADF